MMNVEIDGPVFNQGTICQSIICVHCLNGLTWQSIVNYGIEIAHLPTFVAKCDTKLIGFLTLKVHTACAAKYLCDNAYRAPSMWDW